MKLQHWRGYTATFGMKAAPDIEFDRNFIYMLPACAQSADSAGCNLCTPGLGVALDDGPVCIDRIAQL